MGDDCRRKKNADGDAVAELNNKIAVVVGRVGVETRNDLFSA